MFSYTQKYFVSKLFSFWQKNDKEVNPHINRRVSCMLSFRLTFWQKNDTEVNPHINGMVSCRLSSKLTHIPHFDLMIVCISLLSGYYGS